MMLFDFLFIALVLTTIVVLVIAVINILHGRLRQAINLLVRCGAGLALYLGVVAVIGLFSPQRVIAFDQDRCFDDWCMAVEDVTQVRVLGQSEHQIQAKGMFYVVALRLSNHARGRAQRASSTTVHLVDGQGQLHNISLEGQAAYVAQFGSVSPLTALIPVGQSLHTVQVFDLPPDAEPVGLTVEHPVGFGPGLFIIGDEASLFHKSTIMRLH